MYAKNRDDFEEIVRTTPLADLQTVCELLRAGRIVKSFDKDGFAKSVEISGTTYFDAAHLAAVKSVYRNILIVGSKPVAHTSSGDQVIYTVNNKGREFLEFCRNLPNT